MVTISDIAKKCNVSESTVSRVLNNSGYVKEETRQKVKDVINELNYAPSAIARSLSKKTTNTIGVIVPDITNPYFGEVIKGISSVAENYDLNIIFYNTDNSFEKELKALKVLKEQRIKGIIMTPGFGADNFNKKYKDVIENINCPIVLAGADLISDKLNGVFVDNLKGTFEATKLLISEGYKKIGIIIGPLSSEPMKQRLKGYKKALNENNIKINNDYIFFSDFTLKKAYELTKEMLDKVDTPQALIISTNRMTIGVIKALDEANKRIPEDIALIGADKNELLDIFESRISYIEECPQEIGKTAMEILVSIFNDKNLNNTIRKIIVPNIIQKGSEKQK